MTIIAWIVLVLVVLGTVGNFYRYSRGGPNKTLASSEYDAARFISEIVYSVLTASVCGRVIGWW